MKKILAKIFSIAKWEDNIRYRIIILGIRITFPNLFSVITRLRSPYFYYKKNNLDITKLPKATGQLRDLQLANLAILKEIDYVCKKNNLKYWLEYGTLLGAIRHKGYVPWDDDIDISMLREDYEYLRERFNDLSRDKDLVIREDFNSKGQHILKVSHRYCKWVFVDIFPCDYCAYQNTDDDKIHLSEAVKSSREKFLTSMRYNNAVELYYEYKRFREETSFFNNVNLNDKYNLIYGPEFWHLMKNLVMDYEEIFLLKEIEFEGIKFYGVNDADKHLKRIYGNYMDYPSKINFAHSAYAIFSRKDKEYMKDIANKNI